MSAKPYSKSEIASMRLRANGAAFTMFHADLLHGIEREPLSVRCERVISTVDALQARLAAAEASAERAVGLLRSMREWAHTVRPGGRALRSDPDFDAVDALLKEVADGC